MIWSSGTFCDTPFWNSDLTWTTDIPEFTPCFENTVLLWIPTGILWIISPLALYTRRTHTRKSVPITIQAVSKYAINLILFAVSVTFCAIEHRDNSSAAAVTAHMLKALSFLLVHGIQIMDRRHGVTSSALVFTFWSVLSISTLPTFYRVLVNTFVHTEHQTPTTTEFAAIVVLYPLTVSQVVLFSLKEDTKESRARAPVETATPMSYLTFEWFTALIVTGYKKALTVGDLFCIPICVKTSVNFEKWKIVAQDKDGRLFQDIGKPRMFLVKTLLRLFWGEILLGCVIDVGYAVAKVTTSLVLHLIIQHLQNHDDESWKGYMYAILILLLNLTSAMCVRHGDHIFHRLGLRVKGVLLTAVYTKALRISSATTSQYTVGQLVNIISVDAEKVNKLCTVISMGLTSPVTIIYATYLLWLFLGPSCLAGIAAIALMTPMTGAIAERCRKLQAQQMKLKDSRLQQVGEILTNMKIIKLYGWELPFIDKVRKVRLSEVRILRSLAYWAAVSRVFWMSTSFWVSLFAFTTYIYSTDVTFLSVSTAFVSMTIFNGMRYALNIIPDVVSSVIQAAVSLRRITEFLQSEELDADAVRHDVGDNDAVTFNGATLSWSGSASKTLTDIALTVKRGQLVAIVGQVGSGKSSILSSVLGDLVLQEGAVGVNGSIAHVPQTAWILNSSVRQNILFTKRLRDDFYNVVLDACCLRQDLDMLPHGDMTEIGDRGVNLSGGQKQRVSIARAVLQNQDIYLLDDPLSALDSHIGSSVFENVIGPKGLLREKTRIIVTNNLSVLPETDFIVYMQGGCIVERGTYGELTSSGKHLSMFLKEHVRQANCKDTQVSAEETREASAPEGLQELTKPKTASIASLDAELYREAVETGSVKMSIYVTHLIDVGLPIVLLIFFGYASARAFDIGINLWISEWDHDADIEKHQRRPGQRLGIYAVLGICQCICTFGATAALATGTIRAAQRLHDRMLIAVMRSPMSFFDVTPVGRILNRFGSDVDQLDIQLPLTVNMFLEYIFHILGVFILIACEMPFFLAGILPLLILHCLIQSICLRSLRQIKRLESVTRSPVNNHFGETLAGLSSIRGYSVQKEFTERFTSKVDVSLNCSYLLVVGQQWLSARLDAIANIAVLLVTIMVLRQRHAIDDGLGSMLISYAMGTTGAFTYVVYYAAQMEAAVVASERLAEYSNVSPEADWKVEPGPKPDWPEQGAVQYIDYCAKYREELDLVLREVNLAVKPGERVGVVGRTGAGKSSLTLSLFRIIEAAGGKITIDDVDISSIGLHDLRSLIGIIPQDPVLFSGTLRFNLDPHDEYEDAQLWTALECAHLKHHFPDGLETQISEGGQNISLGQRQLACLARVVLRKSRILVLDEATAAVDLETDRLIQETILEGFADCTLITIAHRLHTIMNYDRIVVMGKGKIIEEGSPAELLRDPASEFASLAREASIIA
ncbi:multidrug resistance-associated protein 1-like [Ornithodoros turicata]|uniref:multidrug resistance-associated protein 1-like n=1 Tax=Ornithodoros turicata TaxID=34597 RepID=UPI003139E473